jgi:hypothetical protein
MFYDAKVLHPRGVEYFCVGRGRLELNDLVVGGLLRLAALLTTVELTVVKVTRLAGLKAGRGEKSP